MTTVRAGKTHVNSVEMYTWKHLNKEVRYIKSTRTVALVENGSIKTSIHSSISARTIMNWLGKIPIPEITTFFVK